MSENKKKDEKQAANQRKAGWAGKSRALLFSAGIHLLLVLIAAYCVTSYISAQSTSPTVTIMAKREHKYQEYDPEPGRAIFKTPRILADRMVEKPIIMLAEEAEFTKDVPRGTSFDNLSNKNLNSTSVVDAYGVGGGAAGAYGQRWGKGMRCGDGNSYRERDNTEDSYRDPWRRRSSSDEERTSRPRCTPPTPRHRPHPPCTPQPRPGRVQPHDPSAGTPHLPHGGSRHVNGEKASGMFFKNYGVNPFIDTDEDHLSTFAVDVDTASYTVARNYLGRGNLPPADAVRTEEFVNYFKYDYPSPRNETFSINLEAAPSKFGRTGIHKLFRVALKGKEKAPCRRKRCILTFVIDVSGSMKIETRLALVKKSLRMLLDQLYDDDKVGIVAYNTSAHLIAEPLLVDNRCLLIQAINSLSADGSTNVAAGLEMGYKMANRHFKRGANNRIILCSDGVANTGVTAAEDILLKVKNHAKKGIYLTSVGFGMNNFNDVLLEKLADKGDGNYAYVDTLKEAKRIFIENTESTLEVIAKDMKVQVDFNPKVVRSYRLLGYENRAVKDKDFRNDRVDAGEVGPGHTVTALYELKMHTGAEEGRVATVYVRYKNPDCMNIRELKRSFSLNEIKTRFAQASTDFRLAAAAAEFAEILRESFWAKDAKLAPVLRLAEWINRETNGRKDVRDFVQLVRKAMPLKNEKERKVAAIER
ncbi:MAG: DUF3520 domain-containing protein [Planctomycetota bacterium]|nr:MAG: DUF3520 domain-containing protein [Planctomycetota bacterium]